MTRRFSVSLWTGLLLWCCPIKGIAQDAEPAAATGTATAPPVPVDAEVQCNPEPGLRLAAVIRRRAEGVLDLYVGDDQCRVKDPAGLDAVETELKGLATAWDATTCARTSADSTVRERGLEAHGAVSLTHNRLTQALAHIKVLHALMDANRALQEAEKARNLIDTKVAAERAAAGARAARSALTFSAAECVRERVKGVEEVAELAHAQVDLREAGPNSMCGADALGRPKTTCGVYGISAAALSYLWAFNGDRLFAGRRLTSVGVPAGAFRYVVRPWLALDFGGYSAFLTKSLTYAAPTVGRVSCVQSPTDYENRLPCEATNEMNAFFGAYAGLTMGRRNVGFLTVIPLTAGIAQLGTRTTLYPYLGLSIGVIQVNGSF